MFTQDHPDERTIGSYYASEEYLSHNDSAKGFSSTLYKISREFMLKRKRRLVERETGLKRGKLLDTGSGTGHFLNQMKQAGWEVNGIEINKKAREYAASSFGLDVISPDKISSLSSKSFDCITLWHVLEHFEDPFRYFSEISRLLTDGGVCITALPNSNSFDAEHYNKFWAAYDVPRHIWHFSPFTFQLFAQKAGFKIRSIKSLPLDVFYISILSEKYMGTWLYFITGIITGKWFWFLSLFKKEKSSSLIYILKKKEN
ncbi:MAG: class I SAM-dependent methyltransferase [Bacteroidales bacterium]|nr:class I SAM-dependent methyltransferase [Bacteroidales bacterium]